MLSTAFPGCDDGPCRRAFKALLPFDKEEKKKVSLSQFVSLYVSLISAIFQILGSMFSDKSNSNIYLSLFPSGN